MKTIFKKGQTFGNWTLSNFLGGGGNGEVWQCENTGGISKAIKLLKRIKTKSYLRFVDETNVIEHNSDLKGIIPIEEKFLPKNTQDNVPFFIMPLAVSSESILFNKSLVEKVDAIVEIAKTLKELHKRKIFHRDIKPANILFYQSTFCFADFGLVDYPNKKEISLKNEEIGAKWTMAPEMKRESSTADLAKADIYSLAKTLWIYLTERTKGFDGQYSTESIIDLKKFYPHSYTSPIDNLLISCTDNDPIKRFTIEKFIEELEIWKKLDIDFHKRNQQQWFEIQTKLFPTSIPQRVIWDDINDIVKVLKTMCSFNNLNHVFFPTGGGLDLNDIRLAYEENCIELDFGSIHIIKPKRLLFESFGDEHQWNYFRIELDCIKRTGLNTDKTAEAYEIEKGREVISELSPGNYFPYEILNRSYKYKNDYLFTNFSRLVTRWLKGSFVIFCKRSTYNLTSSTYDGRHNTVSTDEFREYIQKNINHIKQGQLKELKIENENSSNQIDKKEKLKHFIEEETVYRCGWCGNLVTEKGLDLDDHNWRYNIKVIEKFGDRIVKRIECQNCKKQKK